MRFQPLEKRRWKLPIIGILLLAIAVPALGRSYSNRYSQGDIPTSPHRVEWMQAEDVTLDYLSTDFQDVNATDLSVYDRVVWDVVSWTNLTVAYAAVTGSVEDASAGHLQVSLTPAQANLPKGYYRGYIRGVDYTGTNLVRSDVLVRQSIRVLPSADDRNFSVVGPLSGSFQWSILAGVPTGFSDNVDNVADAMAVTSDVTRAVSAAWPNLDTDSTDDFDGLFGSLSGVGTGLADNVDNVMDDISSNSDVTTAVAGAWADLDTDSTDDFDGAWSSLSGVPSGLYNPDYFTWSADPLVSYTNSSSIVTNTDAITKLIVAMTVSGYAIDADVIHRTATQDMAYTSSDTDVATVSDAGLVAWQSAGTATITGVLGDWTRTTNLTMTFDNTYTQRVVMTGVTGSLRKVVSDMIDDRLTSTSLAVYATQDHAATNYIRNTNCWAADIDLTCASPYNSYGYNRRAGTLITSQHVMFARHYNVLTGTTMRFIAMDNSVVSRVVEDKRTHPDADLCVARLDTAVPASISPALVLPGNYADYLPSIYGDWQIPSISLDKYERAGVRDWDGIWSDQAVFGYPLVTNRQPYFYPLVGGDSGNPGFLVISTNHVVLLTTWHYGGGGSGPAISKYTNWIETAMAEMGTNHISLTRAVVTNYTDWIEEPPTP